MKFIGTWKVSNCNFIQASKIGISPKKKRNNSKKNQNLTNIYKIISIDYNPQAPTKSSNYCNSEITFVFGRTKS